MIFKRTFFSESVGSVTGGRSVGANVVLEELSANLNIVYYINQSALEAITIIRKEEKYMNRYQIKF